MQRDDVKSFHDLIAEVQARGICGRCGGLGSSDGYTTAMVRTAKGEQLYNSAKQAGVIREMAFANKEESVLHRTTLSAKIVSFARTKRERAALTLGSL